MACWRLFYHVVWSTRHRQPVLDEGMIEPITQAIEWATRDQGVTVYAIGVMPDHVHVFAQIPPTLAISTVVGRWKGASSHAANEYRPNDLTKLAWQEGYGVLSVSQSGFDRVLDYVRNQRECHAKRETYSAMERTEAERT
jgi:putative transposase